MALLSIDHAAFPCFDVAKTQHFYSDVLGLPLVCAQTGPAQVWNAEAYLLLVYRLPAGGALDFFAFDGIARPASSGLPKDIHHLALTVATRDEVLAFKDRLAGAEIPFWTETHDADDLHVYTTDPNGVVLEFLAGRDGVASRATDPAGARRVLAAWLAAHPAARGAQTD